MRFDDLATRLVAVEAKLATLTGTTVNSDTPATIADLDSRLSVVEVQVDHLIAEKTQEHIDAIVSAPADAAPVTVDQIVALSPSADVPEAAAIVSNVVAAQQSADAITDDNAAAAVAAAVSAVVTADPAVVTNSEAITIAITSAVAEVPAPAPEVAAATSAMVADIIATATGVDKVSTAIQAQVAVAVATPSDADLDAIEARLNAVEPKIDSLLGK
jgi:tetrahydromethanopterin S-methyltransferase subunit G